MVEESRDAAEEFPLEPPQKDWPRARGKECVVVAEDSERRSVSRIQE